MGVVKTAALSGVVALGVSAAAMAADLPMPVPIPVDPPVPIDIGGGWYLRGDIGVSNQQVDKLDNVLFSSNSTVLDKGFDAAPFFGLGVGYKVSSWLRFDLTGEYRAKANFHGLDRYADRSLPTGYASNEYLGSKSEWVTLANAYVDLGTWSGVTPFVGAGIGAAYNTIHHFRDVNVVTNGLAFGPTDSKWNLAWALYAGLAYEVTPAFTVEFGYRYLNLGHGQSGDLITYDGTNRVYNPMKFKDITSHDFRLGMRWMLGGPTYLEPPRPLMRKG